MPRVTRRERSVRTLLELDELLRTSGPGVIPLVPEGGWIRTVREARGLTQGALGAALRIERSSVNKLEEREADGGATLNALIRAAEALGCTLEYRLVPPGGRFSDFLGAGPARIGVGGAPTFPSAPATPSGAQSPAAAAAANLATSATSHQPPVTGTSSAPTALPGAPRGGLHAAFKYAQELARQVQGVSSDLENGSVAERSKDDRRPEEQSTTRGEEVRTSPQAPLEAAHDSSGETVLPSATSRRASKPRASSTDTGQLDVFGV